MLRVRRGVGVLMCVVSLQADVAKALFELRTIDGFAFDVEVLFLARKHGHSVTEIPVVWINDEASRVDPIRHSLKMFADIMKVRGRHRD